MSQLTIKIFLDFKHFHFASVWVKSATIQVIPFSVRPNEMCDQSLLSAKHEHFIWPQFNCNDQTSRRFYSDTGKMEMVNDHTNFNCELWHRMTLGIIFNSMIWWEHILIILQVRACKIWLYKNLRGAGTSWQSQSSQKWVVMESTCNIFQTF